MTTISLEKKRITSVDLLRGAVMIIMALDHTRDFFHYDAQVNNPLNLDTTTPILFFHKMDNAFLCACVRFFIRNIGVFAICQEIKKGIKYFFDHQGSLAHTYGDYDRQLCAYIQYLFLHFRIGNYLGHRYQYGDIRSGDMVTV